MSVVIDVLCEGHTHRLELRDDGTCHMLDHEEIDVRAFVAFGAKPPGCLKSIDKAREQPVRFLVDYLDIDRKTHILLSCDFAEHVLPIWYEYYPDDHRPRKTIEAARKYVAGKTKESVLKRTRRAAREARGTASEAYWSESKSEVATAAWDAARSAASAAVSAAMSATSAIRGAEWASSSVITVKAARAAASHAEAHGKDPGAARAAEKRWQGGRMVQVVEAMSRGEDPWRS